MKDADKAIIAHLKAAGRMIDVSSYTHSYPFCWRSDTPLIYKVLHLLVGYYRVGAGSAASIRACRKNFKSMQVVSDTMLWFGQAVPSWFVKVTDFRDRLLAANSSTYWVPSHVKDGRFQNWLENARDWCVCYCALCAHPCARNAQPHLTSFCMCERGPQTTTDVF